MARAASTVLRTRFSIMSSERCASITPRVPDLRAPTSRPTVPINRRAEHAALDVERVARDLVEVAGVDHVGMEDQAVGAGGEQARRRRGVAGVAAHLGADAGRHHERRRERARARGRAAPPPQAEDRAAVVARRPVDEAADLAAIAALGDRRDGQPDRRLAAREAERRRRREVVEQAAMARRGRHRDGFLNQLQARSLRRLARTRRSRRFAPASARRRGRDGRCWAAPRR